MLSARFRRGTPVYAASFIRERRIVLDSQLFATPRMLRLIVLHEIFHFVWTRLGNGARDEFANLLLTELRRGVRGELGESAGVKKSSLVIPSPTRNTRQWRNYVCESFCDTAACLYSGIKRHKSFNLAHSWRQRREAWFQAAIGIFPRC